MKGSICLLVLMLLPAVLQADSSSQDFWNGGPGTPGPLSYWGNAFDSCGSIEWSHPYIIELLISYTLHLIHTGGPGCWEMVVVDTDGDGDLDVVGAQPAWDRISHWENLDGQGMSWTRTIIADSLEQAMSLDSKDMDMDGDSDLVIATYDGPVWLENAGSNWIVHTISTITWKAETIRSSDLDGDGDCDIVAADGIAGDYVRLWENLDGSGAVWEMRVVSDQYDDVFSVRSADIDGDGDMDVIASSEVAPKLVWFENTDGQGHSWEDHVICQQIGSTYLMVYCVEACDMDGDGDLDAVAAGNDQMPEGSVVWVENADGFGSSWQLHSVDNSLIGANSVAVADLDGDGDQDVMATAGEQWGEDWVMWYENIGGQASAWNGHVLDSTTWDAQDVAAADIDDDGDLDVVSSDANAGMRWYEFSRATSGWLESSILDPPGGSQLQWTDLSWEATVPPGTILTFQVRASNDPADMGDWSPAFAVPGGITQYLPEPAWYFQYRVNMMTGVPPGSPVLDELLVQYDPVGIEGGPEPTEPCLTVLSGNPSSGVVTLDVYLPEAGSAILGIYDLSGRLVSKPLEGSQETGHQQLTLTGLPAGCYHAVLDCGTERIQARLVVLR